MAKHKYITEKSEDYKLVNVHTGELLDYNYVKKIPIDDFIMVYLATLPNLFCLSGQHIKILMTLWKISSYNKAWCEDGNIFLNDKYTKEAIRATGLKVSDSCIDVAVSRLAKKEFIIKLARGKYLLNPRYFFKGTLSDRSHIKLSVEVDPETKTSKCFLIFSRAVSKEDK